MKKKRHKMTRLQIQKATNTKEREENSAMRHVPGFDPGCRGYEVGRKAVNDRRRSLKSARAVTGT